MVGTTGEEATGEECISVHAPEGRFRQWTDDDLQQLGVENGSLH